MSRMHTRRRPGCDCDACCDGCGHGNACMTERVAPADGFDPDPDGTIQEEVAREDGYIPRRIPPPRNGQK